MSLERDIKEALQRRAGDATPSPAAWRDVERRVRRAYRARLVGTAAVTAAVIAGAVVAIPRLSGGPSTPPVASEGESPSSWQVPDGWTKFRNERDLYQVAFPPEWRHTEFEGVVELLPRDSSPLAKGEPTFALTLRLGEARRIVGLSPDGEIDGHPYWRTEEETTDGGRDVFYDIRWPSGPCPLGDCALSGDGGLRVRIVASTAALWETYGATGERVVRTLTERLPSPFVGPIVTRRGSVAAGLSHDRLTSALVGFMDARLDGGRATLWLGSTAQDQYENARPPAQGLYASGEQVWLDYEIRERADADANSAEFTVLVRVLPTESDPTTGFTETIGVGPGETTTGRELSAIIRFRRFIGTEATAQQGNLG